MLLLGKSVCRRCAGKAAAGLKLHLGKGRRCCAHRCRFATRRPPHPACVGGCCWAVDLFQVWCSRARIHVGAGRRAVGLERRGVVTRGSPHRLQGNLCNSRGGPVGARTSRWRSTARRASGQESRNTGRRAVAVGLAQLRSLEAWMQNHRSWQTAAIGLPAPPGGTPARWRSTSPIGPLAWLSAHGATRG